MGLCSRGGGPNKPELTTEPRRLPGHQTVFEVSDITPEGSARSAARKRELCLCHAGNGCSMCSIITSGSG